MNFRRALAATTTVMCIIELMCIALDQQKAARKK
jgi:hypothetical protein